MLCVGIFRVHRFCVFTYWCKKRWSNTLDIDKDKVIIKLDNNVKCILDNTGDFAFSFDIDSHKKTLQCKYSKQKIKLGTRVRVKVTRIDIPQKQTYVDVKELIKEKEKNNVKKLETI